MSDEVLRVLERIFNSKSDSYEFYFKFFPTIINYEDNEGEINPYLKKLIDYYNSILGNFTEEKEYLVEILKKEEKYAGFGKKSLMDFYYKIINEHDFGNIKIKENIMEKLGMNNLSFSVYINNIKYDFLFTKDDIIMFNNSTKDILTTNYNKRNINSFIFNRIDVSEKNNIFEKNNNGFNICNIILKNSNYLFNHFKNYQIRNNILLKPKKAFIKALCESGNNVDLLEYFVTNHYLDQFDIKTLVDIFAGACFGGNFEMVYILERQLKIEKIKNLNVNKKFNILKQACAGNSVELVEYLLTNYLNSDYGFLLNEEQIIELFEVIKNPAITIFLMKEVSYKGLCSESFLNRVFFEVICNGHIEIAQLLLEQESININVKNTNKRTFLHLAVISECEEAVKLLLAQKNIDVNARDEVGFTPLHLAVINGYLEITKLLLLNQDIEINAKNRLIYTPFTYAFKRGDKKMIELLLLQKGSEIDIRPKYYNTLFNYAFENKNKKVVQLLYNKAKEKGIDINKKLEDKINKLINNNIELFVKASKDFTLITKNELKKE